MVLSTDQDSASAPTSATAVVLIVVIGLPATFILIAVCAAFATGSGRRSRWFLCGGSGGKNKIMKSSVSGGKRLAGTGQRRLGGGKFLDSSSARNLNGRGTGGGRDLIGGSSNGQQQQPQLSCDLQIR